MTRWNKKDINQTAIPLTSTGKGEGQNDHQHHQVYGSSRVECWLVSNDKKQKNDDPTQHLRESVQKRGAEEERRGTSCTNIRKWAGQGGGGKGVDIDAATTGLKNQQHTCGSIRSTWLQEVRVNKYGDPTSLQRVGVARQTEDGWAWEFRRRQIVKVRSPVALADCLAVRHPFGRVTTGVERQAVDSVSSRCRPTASGGLTWLGHMWGNQHVVEGRLDLQFWEEE